MLDEAGRMDFGAEVMDLVEQLWCAYEEAQGRTGGSRERLVGLAYIVAALRQDVEVLWDALAGAPEVQDLKLEELLARELEPAALARASALRQELRRRQWLQ